VPVFIDPELLEEGEDATSFESTAIKPTALRMRQQLQLSAAAPFQDEGLAAQPSLPQVFEDMPDVKTQEQERVTAQAQKQQSELENTLAGLESLYPVLDLNPSNTLNDLFN
jgi:hypothetical protein